MKQLHNISNQFSRVYGIQPQGLVCLLDREFMNERCLYMWVS